MFFSICISVLRLLTSHLRSLLFVFAQLKQSLTLTIFSHLSCEVRCHLVRGNVSCHTDRARQVDSAKKPKTEAWQRHYSLTNVIAIIATKKMAD